MHTTLLRKLRSIVKTRLQSVKLQFTGWEATRSPAEPIRAGLFCAPDLSRRGRPVIKMRAQRAPLQFLELGVAESPRPHDRFVKQTFHESDIVA